MERALVMPLAMAAIGFFVWCCYEYRRRMVAGAAQTLAHKHDLVFEAHVDLDEELKDLKMLSGADERKYTNCLTGESKGHIFRVFDFQYAMGNQPPRVQTVVAIESHNSLPSFEVESKDILCSFLDRMFKRRENEVELLGNCKTVRVFADEGHDVIQGLFVDEIVELLKRREYRVESTPHQFAVYLVQRGVESDEYLDFANEGLQIFHQLQCRRPSNPVVGPANATPQLVS